MRIFGCHGSVVVDRLMSIVLGMPLEHRVFLYDACPKYRSYKKFRRWCRRTSFVAPVADKITIYMYKKRFRGVGSTVDRKTMCSRRVLTDEILNIVDSAFTANRRVCAISTNCNKTAAFTYKKKKLHFLLYGRSIGPWVCLRLDFYMSHVKKHVMRAHSSGRVL
jgi:hypothetical protein